ncbi:hypothetical protein A6R68_19325 [Neotoma lepida]|uniref:HMG box domain-containing protein n=1 Tax=Neotoma lepida TaxID=56216 RepID=A0A1A6HJ95_NEOLE|nr:hypothetical protein A6R68_19325 [Neotoma lepida]
MTGWFAICKREKSLRLDLLPAKLQHPRVGNTARKLGEMWSEQSAKDKPPHEQKAAELKEKYELQDIARLAEGKSDARKKGPDWKQR